MHIEGDFHMRRTTKAVVAAICATVFAASGSQAEDHSRFAGFYAGAHAGGAWSDIELSDQSLNLNDGQVFRSPEGLPSMGTSGFWGGAHAGYNFQSGHFVTGVDLSYQGGDLSSSFLNTGSSLEAATDDLISTDISSIFQAVFRLGYSSGNLLAYGKVGYASGNVETEYLDTSDTIGTPDTDSAAGSRSGSRQRHHGLVLGGGLEYAWGNVILGLDYSYINFEEKDRTSDFFSARRQAVTGNINGKVDPDVHAVVGRISYRFGGHDGRHSPQK